MLLSKHLKIPFNSSIQREISNKIILENGPSCLTYFSSSKVNSNSYESIMQMNYDVRREEGEKGGKLLFQFLISKLNYPCTNCGRNRNGEDASSPDASTPLGSNPLTRCVRGSQDPGDVVYCLVCDSKCFKAILLLLCF